MYECKIKVMELFVFTQEWVDLTESRIAMDDIAQNHTNIRNIDGKVQQVFNFESTLCLYAPNSGIQLEYKQSK